MRKELSNGTGTQDRSAPRVADQVIASGAGKRFSGRKIEFSTGLSGSEVLVSFMI